MLASAWYWEDTSYVWASGDYYNVDRIGEW